MEVFVLDDLKALEDPLIRALLTSGRSWEGSRRTLVATIYPSHLRFPLVLPSELSSDLERTRQRGEDFTGGLDYRGPRPSSNSDLEQQSKKKHSGDGQGGSSFATGQSDDELSTNYGGLDLEALSRLDGRRWSSSCRSQEGLELVAVNRDGEEESMTESIRTLSQKYRPMFFEELIGQNIVVQSLMNAILRGRVASLYLFQGPRGTGKTSTARVLAAALNCIASNKTKLCGIMYHYG
ncbi:hypothetical protein RJ639_041878 [Escallonia herrerae]|uniref:Uncharacterized protein n=1 Tax=Escallonia herrerae TaxID=1293975 RepID=A0AA88WJS0_9ASTE|nr:hypothetical protein RJ639_041878 [Escallonia herrerae]